MTKKHYFVYGITLFILSIPPALCLNLYVLKNQYGFTIPFWNPYLLVYFELSLIFLGTVWVFYAKFISNFFDLEFEEVLKKDLFALSPLLLLLLYLTDVTSYTDHLVSTPALFAAILLLVVIFKAATVLYMKNNRVSAYLLVASGVMLPLLVANYFVIENYAAMKDLAVSERKTSFSIETLINYYDADSLSLFNGEFDGVFKKKMNIASEIRNALVLLPPKKIETTVNIPSAAFLQFGFGVWRDSYNGKGDGIQLNLFLKGKEGKKLVYNKYIDPKHFEEHQRWFDVKLDLKDYVNQQCTIIFEVLGSQEIRPPFERNPDNRDDFAVISDPRFMQSKPEKNRNQYNVILISIDTLRADHLGCYGYKRKEISPNIDKLARDGVLFEKAISHAPWTFPSHMSMFTSLLPSYHRMMKRVERQDEKLAEDITTLSEFFKSNGYRTMAFSSGGSIAGEFGFSVGFDTYGEKPFTDDSSFQELTKWLDDYKSQDFFLFLHTYKVHAPYTHFTYADEVMAESEINELKRIITKYSSYKKKYINKLQEMNYYNNKVAKILYDGGIHETDKYIGKLIEVLKKTNLYDKTIIVLTSDHGEDFGDHSSKVWRGHGHSLYDELLHVPLIFVVPGIKPKERRIDVQVRLIDIMPTLLELASIKYDSNQIQGSSLLPIIQGEKNGDELPAISEGLRGKEQKSIRTNKYKYIYTIRSSAKKFANYNRIMVTDNPEKEELYDLLNDPGETYNLQPAERKLSRKLKNDVNSHLKSAVNAKPVVKKSKIEISKKTREKLKALGYIQ